MSRTLDVRNVAVLGTPDSAILSFVESIVGGEPVPDAREGLSVRSMTYQDHEITFVVVPETLADAVLALSATDTAMFVISTAVDAEPIDHRLAALWEYCAEHDMARIIVLTDADADDADFEDAIMHCQAQFDEVAAIAATHLPLLADDAGVAGLIDLISRNIIDYSGGQRRSRPAAPAHVDLITDDRNLLVEGILVEADDSGLLDTFLNGETIDDRVLQEHLADSVRRGHLYPVLFHAETPAGFGRIELLDLLITACPEAQQHHLPPVVSIDGQQLPPLEGKPEEPLVGLMLVSEEESVKDSQFVIDAYVRIFAGRVAVGDIVAVTPAQGIATEASPTPIDKETAKVLSLAHMTTDGEMSADSAGPGEITRISLTSSMVSTDDIVGATLSSEHRPLIASIAVSVAAPRSVPISVIQ